MKFVDGGLITVFHSIAADVFAGFKLLSNCSIKIIFMTLLTINKTWRTMNKIETWHE